MSLAPSLGVNALYWGPDGATARQRLSANLRVSNFPPSTTSLWLRTLGAIDDSPTAPASSLKAIKQKFGGMFQLILFLGERGITNPFGQNWTLDNWRAYVTKVVEENQDVHIWEVWNEVAGLDRWTGYLKQNKAQGYVEMLRAAYETIKSRNKNDLVLAFGGLGAFVASDMDIELYNARRWKDTPEFHLVNNIWSLGASDYCDGISVHPYGNPHRYLPMDKPTSVQERKVQSKLTMQEIWRGTINSYYEKCKKPIYITETGLTSNAGNSEDRQAEYLRQSFAFLRSLPYVKMILWWNLAGLSQNGLDFALYSPDGKPKRALSALAEEFVA
jgi:hypothetical protein